LWSLAQFLAIIEFFVQLLSLSVILFKVILELIRLLEVIFLLDLLTSFQLILLISFFVLVVFFVFVDLVLDCHGKLRRLLLDHLFLLDLLRGLDGVQLQQICYLLGVKYFRL